MEKGITKNQTMLAGYLAAVGCNRRTVFRIISEVWEENKTIKMLEFCRDNPDATPAELYGMSLTISSEDKEK